MRRGIFTDAAAANTVVSKLELSLIGLPLLGELEPQHLSSYSTHRRVWYCSRSCIGAQTFTVRPATACLALDKRVHQWPKSQLLHSQSTHQPTRRRSSRSSVYVHSWRKLDAKQRPATRNACSRLDVSWQKVNEPRQNEAQYSIDDQWLASAMLALC